MRSPYLIDGPAVISFSGGRTSAYMLKMILDAHGGVLPDDVRVIFANTGKEMPETLDFVEECSQRWAVPITWVEYRGRSPRAFAVVGWATASRNGEPLMLAIENRSMLPNPVARICTVECKILTMAACARSFGWTAWDVVIGIRADEPRRIAKVRANPSGRTRGVSREMPLVAAGATRFDVSSFWEQQPFDLRLPGIDGTTKHGNCDLCFLKGANQVLSLIREKPERALWWMAQEDRIGARFRNDRASYAEMYRMATEQQEMFPYDAPTIEDCFCTD